MKKILFAGMALCFGFNAFAQSGSPLLKKIIPASKLNHIQSIQRLVERQNSLAGFQKPTALKQRVIAQTTDEDGDKDSTAFAYSGLRGSAYNFNDVEDLLYRSYLEDYYYANDYISGLSSDMKADKISYYYDMNDNQTLNLAEQYTGHYRSDNKMDTMNYYSYSSDTVSYADKYVRVYNSQGYLTDIFQMNYNTIAGTSYDTIGRQSITYNNDFSKVLFDTMWAKNGNSWQYSEAAHYSYNNNNQLSTVNSFYYDPNTMTFEPDENTIIQYNNDNKVRSVSVYEADLPASIGLESLDSFIYSPGVDYYTEWYEDNWDFEDYDYGVHLKQFPGANGLPDSLMAYDKDSLNQPYTLEGTLYYTFNSFNNPTKEFIQFPDSPMDITVALFYYEEYDDPTAIQKTETAQNELTVFPNPFAETVHINWKSDALSNAALNIYDFSGRKVFQQGIKLHSGNNTLQMPNLPSGIYLFQLQDAKASMASKMIRK